MVRVVLMTQTHGNNDKSGSRKQFMILDRKVVMMRMGWMMIRTHSWIGQLKNSSYATWMFIHIMVHEDIKIRFWSIIISALHAIEAVDGKGNLHQHLNICEWMPTNKWQHILTIFTATAGHPWPRGAGGATPPGGHDAQNHGAEGEREGADEEIHGHAGDRGHA